MSKRPYVSVLFAIAALLGGWQAHAQTNMLFILDASSSMWGQVDGNAKIATAKATLRRLASDLPRETAIGVMVYGHRQQDDCRDVQLVLPIGQADTDTIAAALTDISPQGKTPIAFSIGASAAAFKGQESANNNVVLISDGIETCDGDPCLAARELAAANIGVRVHVVGFAIEPEERARLECIAEQGKGAYFRADSTTGFDAAVDSAVDVAAAAPAPAATPQPEWTTAFKDDFDGEALADHWTVSDPDPDSYIVENGELLILANTVGRLTHGNVVNMLNLDRDLSAGDWRMTAKIRLELATTVESPFLGLYKDEDNFLAADLRIQQSSGSTDTLLLYSTKEVSNHKRIQFDIPVTPDYERGALAGKLPDAIYLQMEKAGRSYFARARLGEGPQAEWIGTPKLTSLRSPGTPVLGFSQTANADGESLMYVDWVKIETRTAE